MGSEIIRTLHFQHSVIVRETQEFGNLPGDPGIPSRRSPLVWALGEFAFVETVPRALVFLVSRYGH